MKKTYLAMMALAVLTLSCAKSEMPETPSGTTHVIKADTGRGK